MIEIPDPPEHGWYTGGQIHASPNHHLIEVAVTVDVLDGDGARLKFMLAPDQAMSLAKNLIEATHSTMRTQIISAVCGDCVTCGNARLVDGVRCPECGPRFGTNPPTLANRADIEQAVL